LSDWAGWSKQHRLQHIPREQDYLLLVASAGRLFYGE